MRKFNDEQLSRILSAAESGELGSFASGKVCIIQAALPTEQWATSLFPKQYQQNARRFDAFWFRDMSADVMLSWMIDNGMV